jgi:hypothetical protein
MIHDQAAQIRSTQIAAEVLRDLVPQTAAA